MPFSAGSEELECRPFNADRSDGLYGADADSLGLGLPGHDPLTGLPDRRLFKRFLDRALKRVRWRGDYLFAVCLTHPTQAFPQQQLRTCFGIIHLARREYTAKNPPAPGVFTRG